MKKKPDILLIFGGMGKEHSVSVKGAQYLFSKIDRRLFEPIPVYIDREGRWFITDSVKESESRRKRTSVFPHLSKNRGGLLTDSGEFVTADCAFVLLHGDFGEDGTVSGALDSAKIPYVGCNTVASAVCYDKAVTKAVAASLKIPTAEWLTLTESDPERARAIAEKRLSYPMFVKPSGLGSSIGAGSAKDREEFLERYAEAYRLGEKVLVERMVKVDRELECGYFAAKGKELFTDIGQIRYNSGFYDYETKYEGGAAVSFPADIDSEIRDKIHRYSSLLVKEIGIRGICRLDYFLTSEGEILFNEINTMPGFTESSLYPRLIEGVGISVEDAVSLLIYDALSL